VCLGDVADLAFDAAGNLLILANGHLRRLDAAETAVTRVAGFGGGELQRPCPDDVPGIETCLGHAGGIAVDPAGGIFVAASDLPLRRIDPVTGFVHAVTGRTGGCDAADRGDGGPALAACLRAPADVAVDRAGNVFVADPTDWRIRRIDAESGTITTLAIVAEDATFLGAIAIDDRDRVLALLNSFASTGFSVVRVRRDGALETIAGNGSLSFCGDGGPAADACLGPVADIAVGPDDAIYVSDGTNRRVRRIDPLRATIDTVAGGGAPPPPLDDMCRDGVPATATCLGNPSALAAGAGGTLYVVDRDHLRVRRVGADGVITTVVGPCVDGREPAAGAPAAGACLNVVDIALDPADRLTLATELDVWRVDARGRLELLVPPSAACASTGTGCLSVLQIAFDRGGDLYFTSGVHVWRRPAGGGEPVVVAGNGTGGFDGDGGPALAASLHAYRVAVDANANVFVSTGGVVRRIDAATGIITTVAGEPATSCIQDTGTAMPLGSACAAMDAIDGSGRLLYPEIDVEVRAARVVRLTVPEGRPVP
jgi:hypothetical protein